MSPEEPKRGGILACDVATVTGWAYLFPGDKPVYGSHRIAKAGSDHGPVSHAFRTWLGGRIMEHRPAWIVFEAPYIPVPRQPRHVRAAPWHVEPAYSPPPMNMETIYRLCGLCFEVEGIAAEFGIPCRKIETQAWTKGFTGAGRYKATAGQSGREAKKEAVMATCRRLGYPVTDSDAADAIGIAVYAEAILYPKAHAAARPIGGLFA